MTPPKPMVSVIEDDDSLAEAIAGLLRSAGYRTSVHRSAEAFLDSSEFAAAACVVADIQLPGMSGIDLIAQLQTSPVAAIPVIMMTARVEKDLEVRAIASGAFYFLQKPFTADVLLDCIERAIVAGP